MYRPNVMKKHICNDWFTGLSFASYMRRDLNKEDLDLFRELADAYLQYEQSEPVVRPIAPADLYQHLDLSLPEESVERSLFVKALRDLIMHTPRTSSRRFFNQLFGGRKSESVLGELLSVLLNNSMYTYKVAGPMVGVEKVIIREVCRLIDYPEYADGTFAAGGSLTNLMAMIMARDAKDPDCRHRGVQADLVIYTSAESHYSIPKNASFIGIGRHQVRYISVDNKGRMLASDLREQIERSIEEGMRPCLVNATSGTTVLGAFDPIDEIAEVSQAYGCWLHVDGAYCGGVFISDEYRHLIQGVSKADSFSFNAHKMMNASLVCSIIVTKHPNQLYDSFANEANYLFQTEVDEMNLGKISLQCGRRNDALKVWTLWKAIGRKGLSDMVSKQFYLADVARDYVRNHPDYTLHNDDTSVSVCFSYKDIDPESLCSQLNEQGILLVSHGSFRDQHFIRLVTINAGNSAEDILAFFGALEAFVSHGYLPK